MNPVPVEISLAGPGDRERVFEVWEVSVRATHAFLSKADLQTLIPLVREVLAHAEFLHCCRDAVGQVIAFMGLDGEEIAMLFVHPDHFGRGLGGRLARHAMEEHGATRADVNEQNIEAIAFYRHLGFRIVGRSERDGQGNSFPILHLSL